MRTPDSDVTFEAKIIGLLVVDFIQVSGRTAGNSQDCPDAVVEQRRKVSDGDSLRFGEVTPRVSRAGGPA